MGSHPPRIRYAAPAPPQGASEKISAHGNNGPLALAGWALFDWAAQPFYTLVVTFLFAPYFVNGFIADPERGQTLWAYATGIAALAVAVLAPLFGAIADAGHRRKPWIACFSILLVAGLCGLYAAIPGRPELAPLVLVAFGLAAIAAELTLAFTNAMMPSLVSGRRLGRLSGIGWAIGYVGGLVSLVLTAGFLIADPHSGKTLLGLPPLLPLDLAAREGDRLVGPFCAAWFAVFALPLFLFTPDRPAPLAAPPPEAMRYGVRALLRTLRNLVRDHRDVALFLLARMLYADGLGTVFAFGGIYAGSVFGWGATELGLFGIILTLTATLGAGLGGFLDDRFGSKRVISVSLLIFILAAIGVLSVDRNHVLYTIAVTPKLEGSPEFSALGEKIYLAFAMLIGLAAGPIQSASRTLLAKLSPEERMTEFFGFFSFSGKVTAFLAPLAIGAVTSLAASQRAGIATSLIFLIAGLLLLQRVPSPNAGSGACP